MRTFIFVYPDDDDTFVPADSDEFVDGADTSPRQLAQQDHALDVVILEQVHVGAHLGDRGHSHHDNVLALGETVLVEST